jgi:hypothetical protein
VSIAQRLKAEIAYDEQHRKPLLQPPPPSSVEEGQETSSSSRAMVDKRLTASVVATCIERNCRRDTLEVVASVLDFTEDERRRTGLLAPAGGFFSSLLPDWSRAQARAQTVNMEETSFSNLFSDFIQDEIS